MIVIIFKADIQEFVCLIFLENISIAFSLEIFSFFPSKASIITLEILMLKLREHLYFFTEKMFIFQDRHSIAICAFK